MKRTGQSGLRRCCRSRRGRASIHTYCRAGLTAVSIRQSESGETGHLPVLRNGWVVSPLRKRRSIARPVRRKDDRYRQVSWLADRRRCPPSRADAQWHCGQRLTADSCGGSFGFAAAGHPCKMQNAGCGGTEFPISRLAPAPVPCRQSIVRRLPCQCHNVCGRVGRGLRRGRVVNWRQWAGSNDRQGGGGDGAGVAVVSLRHQQQ